VTITWDSVLAWRMRRQQLDQPGTLDAGAITRRLCGVQAQVSSSAELAIALRQHAPRRGVVDDALGERALMRTWAMRGTLHLLVPDEAGAYLALVASARSWERPAWRRSFGIAEADLAALVEAVPAALDGRVLDREELIEQIAARTGSRQLEEHLRSGWGAVLKPLAWMGLLCNGPSRGGRVTFTRPDTWLPSWGGVPKPEQAARIVIPAYLRAHGPATMKTFNAWLMRGAARARDLREWFAAVEDQLVEIEVEGERCVVLTADLDELAGTGPSDAVRLLAGFDQYILGPGTADPHIIAPARRKAVSKAAGWIAPVVSRGGRVAGVWEIDGDSLAVGLFPEAGTIERTLLNDEAARVGDFLGRELRVTVNAV
jgi:hypothetical protein